MKQLKVIQVKGTVRCTEKQKSTLKILKLGKIGRAVTLNNTSEILGQIKAISHLVKVENA